MIQILGLRQIFNAKINAYKSVHSFFDKKWRAKSVPDLFANLEIIMGKIPQEERWNLFYTTAECHEAPGCKMLTQTTIPFDIDNIDLTRIDEYHPIILGVLGLKFEEVGIVCSGNGLQYLVESDITITDKDYFKATMSQYALVCELINHALESEKLDGKTDSSVWSPARLMRLPYTTNKKTPDTGYPNKNIVRDAFLIQKNIVVQKDYSLETITKIPIISNTEEISTQQLTRFPAPDTKAVLEGCDFLKHCKNHPEQISEPAWYAMLSITARLDDGVELSHALSEKSPNYNHRDTAIKINYAIKNAGPRTCKNIDTLWEGCRTCPHYQKEVSPITIRSEDYIRTQSTGFYNVKFNEKTGQITKTTPNYDDMCKFFGLHYQYITDENSQIYIFNGKHWETLLDIHPKRFAEEHFDPKPTEAIAKEFLAKIHRTNGRSNDFFETSTAMQINLQNGVLDLTGPVAKILPHSPDHAFRYVTDYEYDPTAIAPRFDTFMEQITMNDIHISQLLMEFIAYSLTDVDCLEQKALILLGDGANGKSTLLDVVKALVGRQGYSILNLSQFSDSQQAASLQGKMFNLSEETPTNSFVDSSHFKNIVSGGEVTVKVVYKPPFAVRNRAKIIVAANELPKNHDQTYGMWRRFIIVPFNARFSGKNMDKQLKYKLLEELPGVLNIIIEAYYRYRTQKGFTEAARMTQALNEYRNESSLGDFFDGLFIQSGSTDAYVITNTLYKIYLDHCKDTYNTFPVGARQFGRLTRTYIRETFDVDVGPSTRSIKGKNHRVINGFKLCTPQGSAF